MIDENKLVGIIHVWIVIGVWALIRIWVSDLSIVKLALSWTIIEIIFHCIGWLWRKRK